MHPRTLNPVCVLDFSAVDSGIGLVGCGFQGSGSWGSGLRAVGFGVQGLRGVDFGLMAFPTYGVGPGFGGSQWLRLSRGLKVLGSTML